MSKILVMAEVKAGEVRKPTLELLGKIKADGLTAEAVLVGASVKAQADTLAGHGAATVYAADDPSLANFAVDRYTAALAEAVEKAQPDMVWLSASELGKALGPALAARLKAPFVSDCVQVNQGEGVEVLRPAMATKVLQKLRFTGPGLKVITVRSGAFDAQPPGGGASANVVALAVPPADGRMAVKEVLKEETGRIDLGDASTIVSVGRGIKGPEGVAFVQPLVDAMGAAYGASRAVVDSGWMPYDLQVGQTGRVVSPDVYVAVGISGAIQHLAGMSGSKLIVAINKDPDAPIFSVADYGIVGDLFKVVPLMVEEIKKHKS
jgi:electron transfer flavoprotein alpha subunit